MSDRRLQSIVIVGGGTAGWMTAAAIAERFGHNGYTKITLLESDDIGTVGVGEATVPAIREFLSRLKINEIDFIKRTKATFKLAIAFDGWAGEGTRFLHPFANHGVAMAGVPFEHLWIRMKSVDPTITLDEYNLGSQLALRGKCALPRASADKSAPLFNYAFHFDAGLAASYFSSWAQTAGVTRIEGKIVDAEKCSHTGDIRTLNLEDGSTIDGDFFIDCSGFRGVLIEGALSTGYEDWNQWLPCDRAIAVPSEAASALPSYTRALARHAGWQWRIPLQHRVGNGYVYCSDWVSDDQAADDLLAQLHENPLAEPRQLSFRTGMRRKTWNKNVYCIGLSSGFLEPLESTSIYLIQASIFSLLNNFPTRDMQHAMIDEVNRRVRQHWEHIRDFIILHYYLNLRHGEEFWDACRSMEIPASLGATIELYKETGRIPEYQKAFFQKSSWVSLFDGLGVTPSYYHPSADDLGQTAIEVEFHNLANAMREAVTKSLDHRAFLEKNGAILESNL